MEPDVLLLDEPSSHLDEGAVNRLIEVLAGLPQAMILVSHHRPLLAALANRVMHLHGGGIHPADDLHACCDLVAGL
jgi:cobalt/nickel transport system ATP-binding protein